ncbi:hypothetical protein CERSUDRAFT_114115 [Gelatoporia subvermispora B]|uniref:DUF1279 domain-containing protein n=1 Tax=Ceriporiopsis subvermispora (strain B) TaxID=914234 RepID=M2QKE6_CERS8|nr:hypothetical protein CERSUDRAFT_114115 [Gelatoporia subvermispora B]
MVRNFILRFPGIRAIVPRVSRPLLPLTSRLAAEHSPLSLTGTSARSSHRLFHHIPARLTDSPPPSPTSPNDPAGPPPNATLSQRLKYLIKSYGWYALGVYLILSVLDFGVAFAAVNVLGADHVAHFASSVKEYAYDLIHSTPPEPGREDMDSAAAHSNGSGQEGLYAMLVLAYTVHKTLFLPVRVGLTAAFTPRLVSWLRVRGWAGGEGTKRAAREMREKLRNRERD